MKKERVTNDDCLACIHTTECVNGLYCTRLHCYVEYEQVPPCENK